MTKTVRVTLSGDYDHGVHGEQAVFRAGTHTLPLSIARAAHAAGHIDGPAPVALADTVAGKPKRIRAPTKKATPKAPVAAKAFPASVPAKKPAAKAAPKKPAAKAAPKKPAAKKA